jgi:hypothetical protein
MKRLRRFFERFAGETGQALITVTIVSVAAATSVLLFATWGGSDYQAVEIMTQESETLAITDGGEQYSSWVQERDINWDYPFRFLSGLPVAAQGY